MRPLYAVAATVAFLLELCALAALGYWGAVAGRGWLAVALAAVVVGDELALVAVGRPVAGAD